MKNSHNDIERTLGYFDDTTNEFVVTEPQTPYPWINYLGNQDFLGMVSNAGGGYAFYRDAKLRRLTRYRYNDLPADSCGRFFYVDDGEAVWCPGARPARTVLDHYECRHGLGYSRITGRRGPLSCEVLYFIPLDTHAEVHQVTLTNHGTEPIRFGLTSYLEWCLWNAWDDATNFQRNYSTGEVEVEGSTIYHTTEYRERRNHFAFYSVNAKIDGFDTDREAFVGLYNSLALPAAIADGAPRNSIAHGWSPIASHHLKLELAPGASQTLVFLLGYVENPVGEKWDRGRIRKDRAHALIERFQSERDVSQALASLKNHWHDLLGRFSVETGDPRFNRLFNTWNPYQNIVTFNVSRSASLFESGVSRGIGFRDSNQDLLGSVHLMPKRARQRILDLAATQYADGSADHQYQPLTRKGNTEIGSGFNDDPLWLILSTAAYIKETGDLSILDEPVPFTDAPAQEACLFDHLRASFYHVPQNLGPHGLPLIGRADWNDCLNLNCFSQNPDESFQTTTIETTGKAESIMIAGLFAVCGREFIELCRRDGRKAEAERARAELDKVIDAVEQYGWDGRWFLRAWRHDGQKVGSCENREGQIFIEPQGWCVMGGIGLENGRAELALDSVKALLDCQHGVILHYPAYTRYQEELGEISSYPPGYKENGAVFCHTNPWIVIAETMLGRGNRAFEVFRRFSPTWRERHMQLHKTEPYVYAQMIAGKQAHRPGEAKNSWLTGTAAWAFYAASQYILGIRPEHGGLRIDPCIPSEWKGFRITRLFRGATYEIEVSNPAHVCKGVVSVEVDGQYCPDNLIPVLPAGAPHKVKVVLGRVETTNTASGDEASQETTDADLSRTEV